MNTELTINSLYRLPWNLADNAINWLEPTSRCNIYCDGCYRENRNDSHKSIEDISAELDVFQKFRKADSISIAGGEPLIHPDILKIVRMIKERGWKPTINSNGIIATEEMILNLKDAGLFGFTFHIDSRQSRPEWEGKNELELCELRLELAERVAKIGGLTVAFNATIYSETTNQVPGMLEWAHQHINIVHAMVFILYRNADLSEGFDYFVGGNKVDFSGIVYSKEEEVQNRKNLYAQDIVDIIRSQYPDYVPSAFLNGTEVPNSFKWLLAGRMGNKHEIFGWVGSRFMELVQTVNHLLKGTYLAYSEPQWLRRGRLYFFISPFDKGLAKVMKNYFKSFSHNIKAFFSRIYYQTVLIIQPADVLPEGNVNMCDGCPDITVFNGKLVWSCRMEEQIEWGQNVRFVPNENNKNVTSINEIYKNI
ncbi:MAG: putative Fe-S oxidoreductase [Ignavibacteria bacterium]|nr:putative Fe-S oxidoreductase [Ignavibacteria bacterium]